jgi:hypothetical protein
MMARRIGSLIFNDLPRPRSPVQHYGIGSDGEGHSVRGRFVERSETGCFRNVLERLFVCSCPAESTSCGGCSSGVFGTRTLTHFGGYGVYQSIRTLGHLEVRFAMVFPTTQARVHSPRTKKATRSGIDLTVANNGRLLPLPDE